MSKEEARRKALAVSSEFTYVTEFPGLDKLGVSPEDYPLKEAVSYAWLVARNWEKLGDETEALGALTVMFQYGIVSPDDVEASVGTYRGVHEEVPQHLRMDKEASITRKASMPNTLEDIHYVNDKEEGEKLGYFPVTYFFTREGIDGIKSNTFWINGSDAKDADMKLLHLISAWNASSKEWQYGPNEKTIGYRLRGSGLRGRRRRA